MDLITFKTIFSLSISNLMLCAFIFYCIYKNYTYYKVKHTPHFLSGNRCCNTKHLQSTISFHKLSYSTCENRHCSHEAKWKIISKIIKAENSIDIVMYQLTNDDIIDALLIAHHIRMVTIRIIVDKSMFNKDGSPKEAIAKLLAEGIDVRVLYRKRKLVHHKYCVIDPKSRNGILISGSLNWTFNGFEQDENVQFTSNIPIQEEFLVNFNLMWCKTTPHESFHHLEMINYRGLSFSTTGYNDSVARNGVRKYRQRKIALKNESKISYVERSLMESLMIALDIPIEGYRKF